MKGDYSVIAKSNPKDFVFPKGTKVYNQSKLNQGEKNLTQHTISRNDGQGDHHYQVEGQWDGEHSDGWIKNDDLWPVGNAEVNSQPAESQKPGQTTGSKSAEGNSSSQT